MTAIQNFPMVSRFAACALLVGLVAGALALLAGPWLGWRASLLEDIESQRELLGRYRAMTEDARNVARANPRDTTATDTARLFLPGDTDAARTATLQAKLAEFARREGLRFESARGTPARNRNDTRVIGVEVRFSSEIAALQRFLLAMESTEPLLLVDSVQISAAGAGTGRDDTAGRLDVRLDVVGAVAGSTVEKEK